MRHRFVVVVDTIDWHETKQFEAQSSDLATNMLCNMFPTFLKAFTWRWYWKRKRRSKSIAMTLILLHTCIKPWIMKACNVRRWKRREDHRVIDCNNLRNMKGGWFLKRESKSELIRFIPLFPTSMSQNRAPLAFKLLHFLETFIWAASGGALSALMLLKSIDNLINARYHTSKTVENPETSFWNFRRKPVQRGPEHAGQLVGSTGHQSLPLPLVTFLWPC